MTLTKRKLVLRISEETGMMKIHVFAVVQKILDHISEALAKGDSVELRNFGRFAVRIARPRIARNPHQAKIDLLIPARAIVKFKPGRELKAAVLKLPPKQTKKTLRTVRVP